MTVAATYTLPESFALPAKDYIYRACGSLISQHPSLSAIPVGEDTRNPFFVRLPQIDLDQAISFQERSQPLQDEESDPELDGRHDTLSRAFAVLRDNECEQVIRLLGLISSTEVVGAIQI